MRIKVISGFLYPGPGSTYEKGNHGENGDYTVYVLWEMRGWEMRGCLCAPRSGEKLALVRSLMAQFNGYADVLFPEKP